MKNNWFKEWGWIYFPSSWQGFTVLAITLAFSINTFIAVDRNSHSASDTFYGVFPYISLSCIIALWIASKTSQEKFKKSV